MKSVSCAFVSVRRVTALLMSERLEADDFRVILMSLFLPFQMFSIIVDCLNVCRHLCSVIKVSLMESTQSQKSH